MPVSRVGTRSRSSVTPRSPLAPISTAEQVRPAAPMSWIAITQPLRMISRQASNLHGRPLLLGILAELGRSHGGAMNSVAAGLRAEINNGAADAGRLGVEDLVLLGDADSHGVDENVAVVARVKPDRAADSRHPEGIAVAADTGDDARDQRPRLRMFRIAETERIEAGDRTRAHGEDVAQNAADAGRRSLIGLDEGGVIVALHLEDAGEAAADIDDAAFSPGPWITHGALVGSPRKWAFEDL